MVNIAYTPMAINRGQIPGVPGALKESLGDTWEAFAHAVSEARLPLPREPDFAASLLRVWACSDFASEVCVQNPELLYDLIDSGDLLSDYATDEYGRKLEAALRGVDDESGLGEVLRDFAFALSIGVLVGTYSSIFVAAPVLVEWERLRPRRAK